MALEHMENWQIFGIGGEGHLTEGVYAIATVQGIVADPDPSGAGLPVLAMAAGFGGYNLRYIFNATAATAGAALRVYLPGLPGGGGPHFMRWNNASGQRLLTLQISPTGQIIVMNGAGTILGTSALSSKITAKAWHHIEAKVTFSAGAGAVEVRVNGVSALVLAAVNTVGANAGPAAMLEISGSDESAINTSIYFKDWVIWNSSGTLNNDFFGTVQVISLAPNADTALGAWTLTGAANGWSILDNSPPDDTKYIDAAYPGAVGSTAQFGLTDCPIDVTSVRALQTMVRATKTDGGDGNLQASIVSGASVGAGSNRPITAAFTYWKDVFEVDPATGVAWTVAAANAAQLKTVRTV